ncbi:MAG: hypothetical protein ACLGI7_15295, partial [Gammaproteobacteria bacterium]
GYDDEQGRSDTDTGGADRTLRIIDDGSPEPGSSGGGGGGAFGALGLIAVLLPLLLRRISPRMCVRQVGLQPDMRRSPSG